MITRSYAVPREVYNLPEYDGSTTHGLLITSDGQEVYFNSGNGDPRYTNYTNNGHVELKSSRENDVSSGVVYHNNTEGTGKQCILSKHIIYINTRVNNKNRTKYDNKTNYYYEVN